MSNRLGQVLWIRGLFVCVAALAILVASKAHAEDGPRLRLFYLFSAENPVHMQRVAQLEHAARAYGPHLQVIGLARSGMGQVRPGFELRDARQGDAWRDVPQVLRQQLDQEVDYILGVGGQGDWGIGGQRGALPATEAIALLAAVLAALGQVDTPTEVNEGTWGKDKDLFK